MKKKYLKPGCILREVRGMHVMAGSFDISDEGTDDQWSKENTSVDENTNNIHSVWDD